MSIQSIRDNSKGLMAKIIVGAIAVTFALFGVDAIVGFSSSETEVAEVNGEAITDLELARATELLRRQVLAQVGDADPSLLDEQLLQSQALESLIRQQLLTQDANGHKLTVADSRVDAEIINTPAFQVEGVFNRVSYESALRNVGLMPLDFKKQMAADLLIQQKRFGLGLTSFMTPAELEEMARLDRQTRNIAYLTFKTDDLGDDLVVSPEALRQYYDDNTHRFRTAERVVVDFIELKRSDFYEQVTIEESEVRERYEQQSASFAEREERLASHILIEINDDINKQEAINKLETLKQQVEQGTEFSTLAKQHSDDLGSVDAGGELGYNERGAFVGAFEDALFDLEVGQVSEVVETEFGVHLIKLLDVRSPEVPSLDESRAELEREVRHAKAEVLFVDAAEELRNDAFSAGDLEEPALNAGLEIQSTEPFSRSGGDGIATNPLVTRAAFSDEVLKNEENSDLIEITRDHVVVLRLKEYLPEAVQPFEAVQEDIDGILSSKKAAELTESKGQAIIARLESGESTGDVVADSDLEWRIEDKVIRSSSELDAELVQTVFSMPKPAVGEKSIQGLTRANGDYHVIVLTRVHDNNAVDMAAEERAIFARLLATQLGNYDYAEYQASLRDSADIDIRERQ